MSLYANFALLLDRLERILSTWSFFATSHGKSPCDGIGGTIKRLTARSSLQRVSREQIITATDMVKFCQEQVLGITTIFIPTEAVQHRRGEMKNRYQLAKTIPGTRSFHYFEAVNNYQIGAKRISSDARFALIFSFKSPEKEKEPINVTNYIACKYVDGTTWIANVQEVTESETTVKFLHPKFPAPTTFGHTVMIFVLFPYVTFFAPLIHLALQEVLGDYTQ